MIPCILIYFSMPKIFRQAAQENYRSYLLLSEMMHICDFHTFWTLLWHYVKLNVIQKTNSKNDETKNYSICRKFKEPPSVPWTPLPKSQSHAFQGTQFVFLDVGNMIFQFHSEIVCVGDTSKLYFIFILYLRIRILPSHLIFTTTNKCIKTY